MAAIETQIFEQNPDSPEGYLRLARTKTVGEVYREIRSAFGDYPEGCEEYLSAVVSVDDAWPCPLGGHLAVFVVTGGSEGHYVHVEVLCDGDRTLVLLGKTFAGWDAAWYFARRLAEKLGV